jgi:protein SCO1
MHKKQKFLKIIIPVVTVIVVFISLSPGLYSHNIGSINTKLISIDEKLGQIIPMDLAFTSETGSKVLLSDVINGPTILTIIYYRCPNVCSIVVSGLATVIRNSSFDPGKEPNIVTVSINENENSIDSMKTKKIAYQIIQKPYPANKWHFLTGNKNSIAKLTDSVGFHFEKNGSEYDHPIGLIILSPKGKIVRYIMGTDYLPVDITMSLMEASSGITGPTIARVLRFCFSYDPASHSYVFNTLRISAIVIITLVLILILYLVISGKKKRASKGELK